MPAPHHSIFLQAGCPSCRPTNSVKALKAKLSLATDKNIFFKISAKTTVGTYVVLKRAEWMDRQLHWQCSDLTQHRQHIIKATVTSNRHYGVQKVNIRGFTTKDSCSRVRLHLISDASTFFFFKPPSERPLGQLRMTWMNNIHDDLSSLDLGIHEARDLAQNRPLWRLMSLHSDTHS